MSFDRILIVGAGRAGVAAAEELRGQGYRGQIVVLHDETGGPYDRPSCAKGLLTGHKRPADVRLPIRDGTAVHWRLGRRAVHLDTQSRTVYTDTDEAYEYDGLVVATGAAPAAPKGWPVGEPKLHLLYRLSDAWALRADLRDAERVAVVGAGLTGCEVAHAVRSMARECVLVDSKQYAMARPLGDHVGRMVTSEIARDRVKLHMGRRVSQIMRGRRGWVLVLDDGQEEQADVVVVTTGERPDTGWLSGTPGLDVSDGVLCDANLRVVGAQDVVAAGTVARWPNLRYSAEPVRVGQWIAAMEQGRAAARTLLAGDVPLPPVTHVPRFWSDQFGMRIQVCGQLPADGAVSVTEQRPGRRDLARAGVLVGYHVEDRLVGLVAVNAPHAFTPITRAMLTTAAHLVPSAPVYADAPVPVEAPVPAEVAAVLRAPARRRLAAVS